MPKSKPSAEQQEYWDRLREYGCCVSRLTPTTIHHVHGGSMRGIVSPGMSQRSNHWLVIPLHISLHSMGQFAIDGGFGVRSWEAKFGSQLFWLNHISSVLGVDVFERAGIDKPAFIPKYPEDV